MHIADIDNRGKILKCVVMVGVLLLFEAATFLPKRRKAVLAATPDERVTVSAHPLEASSAMRLAFIAACVWVVLIFGSFSGNNFIYFQF
jgi:hypothetical protein